jgi:Flagellar hook-length control protein FliK
MSTVRTDAKSAQYVQSNARIRASAMRPFENLDGCRSETEKRHREPEFEDMISLKQSAQETASQRLDASALLIALNPGDEAADFPTGNTLNSIIDDVPVVDQVAETHVAAEFLDLQFVQEAAAMVMPPWSSLPLNFGPVLPSGQATGLRSPSITDAGTIGAFNAATPDGLDSQSLDLESEPSVANRGGPPAAGISLPQQSEPDLLFPGMNKSIDVAPALRASDRPRPEGLQSIPVYGAVDDGDNPDKTAKDPLSSDVMISQIRQETHFMLPRRQNLASQIAAAIAPEAAITAAPVQSETHVVKVLDLRLEPHTLGEVSVRMVLRAGSLHLSLKVKNEALAVLIRNAKDELGQQLLAAGCTLESLSVGAAAADTTTGHRDTPASDSMGSGNQETRKHSVLPDTGHGFSNSGHRGYSGERQRLAPEKTDIDPDKKLAFKQRQSISGIFV